MVVEAGETFPNGARTPDDCHRFCRCSAYELSTPDDLSNDDLASMDSASLIAQFAIGFLPSRHDRDVAHQQQQDTGIDMLAVYFDDDSDDDA